MNIRIVERGNTLIEIRGVAITEVPEEKSTLLVGGEWKYCCRLSKSYERVDGIPQVWFVADVY